jgi:hypothetical protein
MITKENRAHRTIFLRDHADAGGIRPPGVTVNQSELAVRARPPFRRPDTVALVISAAMRSCGGVPRIHGLAEHQGHGAQRDERNHRDLAPSSSPALDQGRADQAVERHQAR